MGNVCTTPTSPTSQSQPLMINLHKYLESIYDVCTCIYHLLPIFMQQSCVLPLLQIVFHCFGRFLFLGLVWFGLLGDAELMRVNVHLAHIIVGHDERNIACHIHILM